MAKIKPEEESKLQVAGQKKSKLQLSIPAIKMPHDRLVEGLFVVEPSKVVDEVDEIDLAPHTPPNPKHVTQPTPPNPDHSDHSVHAAHTTQRIPRPLTPPNPTFETPAAPMRDFHKMDNSVTRGIPEYFKNGKIKLIYDVLYQRSRGAFPASHTVQISRSEIMQSAGIGSMNTIDKAMRRLSDLGLVTQTFLLGDRAGNVYEVRTPKELGYLEDFTQPTPPNLHHPTPLNSPQNVHDVRHVDSALSGDSQTPTNTGVPEAPKTLFKDSLNHDDEKQLIEAIERLGSDAMALTGNRPPRSHFDCIAEIVHMIADDIDKASRNTKITDYGKFAVTHIRRKLIAKNRNSQAKVPFFDPGREVVLEENAVDVIDIVPEPLDAERKEINLQSLRQMVERNGIEHIEVYRSNFTGEDWAWLMENLESDE